MTAFLRRKTILCYTRISKDFLHFVRWDRLRTCSWKPKACEQLCTNSTFSTHLHCVFFFIDLKKAYFITVNDKCRKKGLVIVTWSFTIDFLHFLRSCLNIKKIKKKSNNIVFHYRHTMPRPTQRTKPYSRSRNVFKYHIVASSVSIST